MSCETCKYNKNWETSLHPICNECKNKSEWKDVNEKSAIDIINQHFTQDKLQIIVAKGNLFEVDEKYYLAHCISSDIQMGAGIALDFQKNFNLRNKLLRYKDDERKYPTCIQIGKVFNLITKAKYWNKPTYQSLRGSLEVMRDTIVKDNIKYIAMPKIGCGLDRLQWGLVREIIKDTFKNIEIEILVMHL